MYGRLLAIREKVLGPDHLTWLPAKETCGIIEESEET